MRKIIGYKIKKANGLNRPLCENMPKIKKIKFTDREIGGVTYRAWSAFTDKVNAADSLENLMLNRLESEESEEQSDQEGQEFPTLKM